MDKKNRNELTGVEWYCCHEDEAERWFALYLWEMRKLKTPYANISQEQKEAIYAAAKRAFDAGEEAPAYPPVKKHRIKEYSPELLDELIGAEQKGDGPGPGASVLNYRREAQKVRELFLQERYCAACGRSFSAEDCEQAQIFEESDTDS